MKRLAVVVGLFALVGCVTVEEEKAGPFSCEPRDGAVITPADDVLEHASIQINVECDVAGVAPDEILALEVVDPDGTTGHTWITYDGSGHAVFP